MGPITVAPDEQAAGIGRLLMQAALDRATTGRRVRLLQDSFNTASLALYASLGFEVAEQVVLVVGVPFGVGRTAVDVRPLDETDLDACERLCLSVHG